MKVQITKISIKFDLLVIWANLIRLPEHARTGLRITQFCHVLSINVEKVTKSFPKYKIYSDR